jgi:hypothetical protein
LLAEVQLNQLSAATAKNEQPRTIKHPAGAFNAIQRAT